MDDEGKKKKIMLKYTRADARIDAIDEIVREVSERLEKENISIKQSLSFMSLNIRQLYCFVL